MRRSHDDGQGATRRPGALRRLTGRREALPRSDSERINALAAEADVPVEDVLREVADFRLALETDMIIAAAAMDAESPDLLSEVLDGERNELATFHDRVLTRLADAAADDELALRRAKRPTHRVSRFVATAAAAVAVLSAGRLALTATQQPRTHPVSNAAALAEAQDQYDDFSSAVAGDSPGAVKDAADQLHETLQSLIRDHAGDPEVARRTAQLLQAEISLLRANDPAGARLVLAQAQSLVTLLRGAAPPQVQASVAPLLDVVAPRAPKTTKPKPATTPSATPSATPKATPTPSATASETPKDDKGPLDTP
jgi:hypothetical protein